MKGELSQKSDIFPKVEGFSEISNMDALAFLVGALNREIKESITADADDAHSTHEVTSWGSLLNIVEGSFRMKRSESMDGGLFSRDKGGGKTKDAEAKRRGGEKLT